MHHVANNLYHLVVRGMQARQAWPVPPWEVALLPQRQPLPPSPTPAPALYRARVMGSLEMRLMTPLALAPPHPQKHLRLALLRHLKLMSQLTGLVLLSV